MADRRNTGLPTENWRWPAGTDDALLPAQEAFLAEMAQLRRDREELVEALEGLLAARTSCELSASYEAAGALLTRIKGSAP